MKTARSSKPCTHIYSIISQAAFIYITTAVTSSNLADKMGFDRKQAEIVMSPHGKNVNMELLLLLLIIIIM